MCCQCWFLVSIYLYDNWLFQRPKARGTTLEAVEAICRGIGAQRRDHIGHRGCRGQWERPFRRMGDRLRGQEWRKELLLDRCVLQAWYWFLLIRYYGPRLFWWHYLYPVQEGLHNIFKRYMPKKILLIVDVTNLCWVPLADKHIY